MIPRKNSKTHQCTSAFTLVEIMIVVLIIGILLSIAVPNFLQARESSRSKACIQNLREIDTAKQQWMMDFKSSTFSSYQIDPGATSAGVLTNYIHQTPHCPENGYYNVGTESLMPICVTASNGIVITGSTGAIFVPHQLS